MGLFVHLAAFAALAAVALVGEVEPLSFAGNHVCRVTKYYNQKYTTNCGFWGWSSCTRYRTKSYDVPTCCAGWRNRHTADAGCDHPVCYGKIDPGACKNGGHCSNPDFCAGCWPGYYSPKCDLCPQITNCKNTTCVYPDPDGSKECAVCRYEHGALGSAYEMTTDKKQCLQKCSWRGDSNACFPGTCGLIGTCACTAGFDSPDKTFQCRKIMIEPDVDHGIMTLRRRRTATVSGEDLFQDFHAASGAMLYTNMNGGDELEMDLSTKFTPAFPTEPAWIPTAERGITAMYIRVYVESGRKRLIKYVVNSTYTNDNPYQAALAWKPIIPLSYPRGWTIRSGQILSFEIEINNGGHVVIRDLDNAVNNKKYFIGNKVIRGRSWMFDFNKPYHCSRPGVAKPCTLVYDDIMYTGPGFTANSNIQVTWDGWEDDISGINEYIVTVRSMTPGPGDTLQIDHTGHSSFFFESKHPGTTKTTTVTLPANTNVYEVELRVCDTVEDTDKNCQIARRLVLYDSGTTITTEPGTSLGIESASPDAKYLWQTNLQDALGNGPQIIPSWSGHFANRVHRNMHLLGSLAGWTDTFYDHITGDRNISSISNVHGIIMFQTVYAVDRAGGSTIMTSPAAWQNVSNFLLENQGLDVPRQDGESVRVWVKAIDIMGHELVQETLVHIDSSPPVIRNLWLRKDNRVGVAVHNVRELHELTIEWETFDIDSGLHTVEWILYDNFTKSEVIHGSTNVTNQHYATLALCQSHAPSGFDCYCTPMSGCFNQVFSEKPLSSGAHGGGNLLTGMDIGTHDHDYYIMIRTTNKARLVTTSTIQITIDTSAPHPGVVHDGKVGENEVDYQTDMILYAHWNSFFDRESGVSFYHYKFGLDCHDRNNFTLYDNSTETFDTQASWIAPGPGTYYITVVAFNPAMDASHPVCSDGVTIDTTPPEVTELFIENLRVRSGVVQDGDGNVWTITEDREKILVDNAATSCVSNAASYPDVSLFPEIRYQFNESRNVSATNEACENLLPFTDNSYLIREDVIIARWQADDEESNFADFEIGLASTLTAASAPDVMPFSSTHRQKRAIFRHPNIREGSRFYFVLKAKNRANLETIKTIGPISVDITPPEFKSPISVSVSGSYLTATWTPSGVYDNEDADPLRYTFAIGSIPGGTNTMSYRDLQCLGPCTTPTPGTKPSCSAVNINQLQWNIHENHVYYVTIKVENSAQLSLTKSSSPYTHNVQLPTRGVVVDVVPVAEQDYIVFGKPDDADYQVDTTELSARWSGFDDPHLPVTYSVEIGTSPGSDDVLPKAVVTGTSYTATGLTLATFTTYYFTVTATNSVGAVSVTSDGVKVIAAGTKLTGVVVNDGVGCLFENVSAVVSLNLTHHDVDNRVRCSVDKDFQASVTSVGANWVIPPSLAPYITNVWWAVEEQMTDGNWSEYIPYQNLAMSQHGLLTNQGLLPGHRYRSRTKFCQHRLCFEPIVSNGFWVTPNPPSTGSVQTQYQEPKQLTVAFEPFVDPNNPFLPSADLMSHYEWTLTDADHDGSLILPWQRMTGLVTNSSHLIYTTTLPKPLTFRSCVRVAIRGSNKAGLATILTQDVRDCDAFDPAHIVAETVVDVLGPIFLDENAVWLQPDADYTPSLTNISAVWPTLRHGSYDWAVIADHADGAMAFFDSPNMKRLPVPCDHPFAIKCGSTDKNYLNVNLTLHHGDRYYVCIHANDTELHFEKFTQNLANLSVCSNGITVDVTPPRRGEVWIGYNKGQEYQNSLSEMVINWDSFIDVEEHGRAPHHSGIKTYEYAIGTLPRGIDVVDYVTVGLTNHAIARDLHLQTGHTYYVTVRATDFTGLQTLSVSRGVTADVSGPEKTDRNIRVGNGFIQSTSTISASWDNVFYDLESGIDFFEWGVGSKAGTADIMVFQKALSETVKSDATTPLALMEGHSYYVSVKAYNKAGLSSIATSWPILVDATPPDVGHVHDVVPSLAGSSVDEDYQTATNTISAKWDGFYDPHSSIMGYQWRIGSCPGCSDVLETQHIGLETDGTATDLNLIPGFRYYVTVAACNSAELCTTVTSDGIMVDNSPPTIGVVYDGNSDEDISYQASSTTIGAHWYGFSDAQTALSHYEWFVGTTPGGHDVIAPQILHVTEAVFLSKISPLPINTMIYITVKAHNFAGLTSQSTSNGFKVDTTQPTIVLSPQFDTNRGSFRPNTQVLNSVLKLIWKFSEPESNLYEHFVSVFTHHNGGLDTEPIRVDGSAEEYTFTNLTLHDGGMYYARVIACNAAKLCTTVTTPQMTVDSSPPHTGMFAIETDHVTGLQRHLSNSMKWTSSDVKLAWLGFSDHHTDIDFYSITVGTSFMGTELTTSGPSVIPHASGVVYRDEGDVQNGTVPLSMTIRDWSEIYVTLRATNKVGLASQPAHSKFVAVPGGDLQLVRRCQSTTCLGHCVCAPQHQQCDLTPAAHCMDISSSNPNHLIEVYDILDLTFPTGVSSSDDVDYMAAKCIMAAQWRVTRSTGKPIVRYEYSVGYSDALEPTGIFNKAHERVFFDIGLQTHAVVNITRQGITHIGLVPNLKYKFFIRAWYDDNTFAVFTSDGVYPDVVPPEVNTVRGAMVKDLARPSHTLDADYLTDPTTMSVTWVNKFREHKPSAALSHFDVAISTYPGGSDVINYGSIVTNNETEVATATRLTLATGIRYYSNVKAVNRAGLSTVEYSDGLVVDTEKPIAGMVFDGLGLHDTEYQNSTTIISASWHGFVDLHSFIDHYMWCAGTTTTPTEYSLMPCRDVGLHLTASYKLSSPLKSGDVYYNKLYAVDAAGLTSDVIVSDGVMIDATPPIIMEKFIFGFNRLDNPSFETSPTVINNINVINHTMLSSFTSSPAKWTVGPTSHVAVVKCDVNIAKDGESFAILFGEISQTFVTSVGEKYRVTFSTSHVAPSETPLLTQEGLLMIPGLRRVFKLYQRPDRLDYHVQDGLAALHWQNHFYYFTATQAMSTVTIASVGERNAIAVDDFKVESCGIGKRPSPLFVNPVNQLTEPIHVDIRFLDELATVHVNWDIEDPESPIVDFSWAIGTVAGGTQLQGFTSVGRRTFAHNSDISLPHRGFIHITVVATNAAGLRTAVRSDPILVDTTSPEISWVWDGDSSNGDLTYQQSTNISIQFFAKDDETELNYCEWCAGLSSGSCEVIPFQVLPRNTFSATHQPNASLVEGQQVFVTIRCENNVERTARATSNGVYIITAPPDSSSASIDVTTASISHYPTRDSFQSQNDVLNVAWRGFSDPLGVEYYELKVDGPGVSNNWLKVGENGQTHASISGLSLTDGATYTIYIRAVNHMAMCSGSITRNITIETKRPLVKDPNLHHTWPNANTLQLTWGDMFEANSTLVYELSVGTIQGGTDVFRWVETMSPVMTLQAVDQFTDYYAVITAVNAAGLFRTKHFHVAPITPMHSG